jgi:hypothetical protein
VKAQEQCPLSYLVPCTSCDMRRVGTSRLCMQIAFEPSGLPRMCMAMCIVIIRSIIKHPYTAMVTELLQHTGHAT